MIYDRNRATINALSNIFPSTNTILYIQYIDTVVRANVYKLFGQQKDKYTHRYIASELIEESIQLYKTYCYILIEEAFNQAYIAIDKRTKYSKYNDYNTNDSFTTIEIAIVRAAKIDVELEEELDIIVRLLLHYTKNAKAITTIVKDILERQ